MIVFFAAEFDSIHRAESAEIFRGKLWSLLREGGNVNVWV